MTFTLTIEEARDLDDIGRSFPLKMGDNFVGRDPDADIRICSDPALGRRTFGIRWDGVERLTFVDVGAKATIRISDDPATDGMAIGVGDSITTGFTTMTIQPSAAHT